MTKTPEYLAQRCADILAGAGDASLWIDDVRKDSQRMDREAPALIEHLRRSRNLARRLGAAAERPMSVGFFGLSQAGKSYLISALAANRTGQLETVMDGRRLNFISHVNPPGDGKEATGMVTRFTRRPVETPSGRPVVLTLFSQADFLKILGNTFFCDFDLKQIEVRNDPEMLRNHVKSLEARRQSAPTGGLSADDVVDVKDYYTKRFGTWMTPFVTAFFPAATELAPRLGAEDRAQLFSVLWNGVPELTARFLQLARTLAVLGHARTVAAPLSALVTEGGDGQLSQMDSIVNVDMLQRLGSKADEADLLEVAPKADGHWLSPVPVSRAVLAALSMEMLFALADEPQASLMNSIDLLDFPGYRGRLEITSLDGVKKALKDASRDPVAELVLRGKVAYLFERYTDDQEMNVLVMCAPCDKQSDVAALGPALQNWIQITQGESAQARAQRKPGLLWAITKMDLRMIPKPNETEDLMRGSWIGMMQLAMLERFGKYEWMQEWAPGRPFDNVFLVRKRGMASAVIETHDLEEKGILPAQEERMNRLRTTFAEDELVRRHIAGPAQAWDDMLALNDGGMGRLAAYLEQVAVREIKLARIAEQVEHITRDLTENQLGHFFRADGPKAVEDKEKLVKLVTGGIKAYPTSFGELLRAMQPTTEALRALYLAADDVDDLPAATAGSAPVPKPSGGLIDLDDDEEEEQAGDTGAAPPARIGGGRAAFFAYAAVSAWIRQLRSLPEDADMHRFLNLPSAVLQAVVDEIITGSEVHGLARRLEEALAPAEMRASTTRSMLADQQALVAGTVFADYIDTLGFADAAPDKRPVVQGDRRIFTPPPEIGDQPQLGPAPVNFSKIFIFDWFAAFKAISIANIGQTAGSEISPEQNKRLGDILARIGAATLGVRYSDSVGA